MFIDMIGEIIWIEITDQDSKLTPTIQEKK